MGQFALAEVGTLSADEVEAFEREFAGTVGPCVVCVREGCHPAILPIRFDSEDGPVRPVCFDCLEPTLQEHALRSIG